MGIIHHGAVGISKGRIFWVGKTEEISETFALSPDGREIDGTGKVVMPGLVDSHTHLIFAGQERMNLNKEFRAFLIRKLRGEEGESSQRLWRPDRLPLMNFLPLAGEDWTGCFPRE